MINALGVEWTVDMRVWYKGRRDQDGQKLQEGNIKAMIIPTARSLGSLECPELENLNLSKEG